MITKGDYLGFGDASGKLSLFAVAEKVDKDWVTAWVVNGCWTLKFDHGMTHFEIVEHREPLSHTPVLLAVVPKNQMPSFSNYEDGFDKMEDLIWGGEHRVSLFWFKVFKPFNRARLAFKASRLGRAIDAFKAEWQRSATNKSLPAPGADDDDEIAF